MEGSDVFVITMSADQLSSEGNAFGKWYDKVETVIKTVRKDVQPGYDPCIIFAVNKWDKYDEDEKEYFLDLDRVDIFLAMYTLLI